MKKHVLWLALAVVAFVLGTAWMLRRKPTAPSITPRDMIATTPAAAPATAPRFTPPAGNQAAPPKPTPVTGVEDGKTLDFSKGIPIVKDTEKDKAALERALKEMEAAAQGVTFKPKADPPPPPKK